MTLSFISFISPDCVIITAITMNRNDPYANIFGIGLL